MALKARIEPCSIQHQELKLLLQALNRIPVLTILDAYVTSIKQLMRSLSLLNLPTKYYDAWYEKSSAWFQKPCKQSSTVSAQLVHLSMHRTNTVHSFSLGKDQENYTL